MQIKDERALTFLGKLKGDLNKRPRDRYCCFHRDHGHDTADYYEATDRSPYQAREVTKVLPQGENRSASSRASPLTGQRASQTTFGRHRDDCGRHGDYRLIQEGLKDLPQNVQMTGVIPKMPRVDNPIIGFSEEDAWHLHHPHDDALAISIWLGDYKMYRVLVDNSSIVDILYYPAF